MQEAAIASTRKHLEQLGVPAARYEPVSYTHLFNMNGELVGIVNAKSSSSDAEGLGFAIPINAAIKVAQELLENGYVTGRCV